LVGGTLQITKTPQLQKKTRRIKPEKKKVGNFQKGTRGGLESFVFTPLLESKGELQQTGSNTPKKEIREKEVEKGEVGGGIRALVTKRGKGKLISQKIPG